MSWSETGIPAARRRIVKAAQDMLAGKLSYIEGAWEIVAAGTEARLDERDSDLLPFVGIVSETDALPLGEMRKHWQAAALERFPAKACPGLDPGWKPVRVKKTRQNKKPEPRSDSIGTERAPDALQPEIENKEAWARGFGERHCQSLVERFSE